ncbi:MAG: hypothetical protein LBH64_04130 [Coriobacteriales bacterium]|jgi:hypothetical protein|nr:hypothetical protein [Coriobacteriales bacterium]
MKNRFALSVVMVFVLALGMAALSACGSSEKPAEEGGGGSGATLPNPQVEVPGPESFKEQLDIDLEPDPAGTNLSCAIIDDKLAQISYDVDVAGQPAMVVVRMQKTPAAEDISGINDSFTTVEPGKAVGDVAPTLSFNEGEAGYAQWYDSAAGVSGTATLSSGASAEELDKLVALYVG